MPNHNPSEAATEPAKTAATNPTGIEEAGEENAAQLPGDERAIELPIEENDFNAQPV